MFFIYRMSTLFRVEPDPASGGGVQVCRLYGALFFGAVAKMDELAEALPAGTRVLVLEMHRLVLMDTSGLDALERLHRALERQGVQLLLCDINEQPRGLIRRSGFEATLGADRMHADLAAALLAAQAAQATAA
jgi:SulP family sulfate permease